MAVGHSDEVELENAVEDVLRQCAETLGGLEAKAGLLFSTHEAEPAAVIAGIRGAHPGIDLVGTTSAAELSSAKRDRHELADPDRRPHRPRRGGRDRRVEVRIRRVGRHGQRREPLETTAAPDSIHVSEPVSEALAGAFALEPRGVIDPKGEGEMRTFVLAGRTPHAA
jgi:hypothetical protein